MSSFPSRFRSSFIPETYALFCKNISLQQIEGTISENAYNILLIKIFDDCVAYISSMQNDMTDETHLAKHIQKPLERYLIVERDLAPQAIALPAAPTCHLYHEDFEMFSSCIRASTNDTCRVYGDMMVLYFCPGVGWYPLPFCLSARVNISKSLGIFVGVACFHIGLLRYSG